MRPENPTVSYRHPLWLSVEKKERLIDRLFSDVKHEKMRKLVISFITFIFIGCNTHKNDKVVLISLYPRVSWDSLGVPQLVVRQYAEFSFSTKDSLIISRSENMFEVDNMKTPLFGLDSFYHYNVNGKFIKSMTKLLDYNYKKTYRRSLSEGSIDDRNMDFIIIIRGNFFNIIPYEHNYLPEELKQINDSVDKYVNSKSLVKYKHNYPLEIISRLQDSLFKRLSPPRQLNSTVKFKPQVLNDEKEN